MGVSNLLSKFGKPAVEQHEDSQATTPARADSTLEKDSDLIDDSPVKYLTWRSFILGIVVSMGGFVFGYATGKLSLWGLFHRSQSLTISL
jgi:SP family sugar:H+ symporter-like MFS transporter